MKDNSDLSFYDNSPHGFAIIDGKEISYSNKALKDIFLNDSKKLSQHLLEIIKENRDEFVSPETGNSYSISSWENAPNIHSVLFIYKKEKRDRGLIQSIVLSVPFPAKITDSNGFTLVTNNLHKKLFKDSEPENGSIFNDPLLKANNGEYLMALLRRGETVFFPDFKYQISKDQIEIWLRMVGFSITVDNEILYVFIQEDITARKNAEIDLIESKKSYLDIYNSVSEAIFIQSRDGIILDVNPAAEKMYGYNRKEFIGKTPRDVSAHELNNIDEVEYNIKRVFDSGVPISFEFWAIKNDNTIFPKLIKVNRGKYFGKTVIISTATDISDQKKSQKEIENQKRSLDNILSGTGAGTWEWDISNDTIQINDKWANMMGFSLEELTPLHCYKLIELIHPEDRALTEEALKNHLEKRSGQYYNESRYLTKTGEWRYFLDRGRVVEWDTNGRPLIMAGIRQDITSRKSSELELEKIVKRNDALIKANPDTMFVIDSKFRIIDYRVDNIDELFLLPLDFLNRDLKEILSSDIFQKIKIAIDEVNRGKRLSSFTYSATKGENTEHFEARITEYGKGEYLAIVRNITEKIDTEHSLNEVKERLSTLINSSPDIICFKDGDGRWLIANNSDLKTFELEEVDYVGKTDAELAEYTNPIFKEALLSCIKSDEKTWEMGVTNISEEIIPTTGGENRVFETIKIPLFNPDKSRKGIVILGRDVTMRENAISNLREREEKYIRLQELFYNISNNNPDLIWAKDLEGNYLFVNRSMANNMLCIDAPETAIGHNDSYFIEKQRSKYPENPLWHTYGLQCNGSDKRVISSAQSAQFEEDGYIKGEYRVFDIVKAPLVNQSGAIIGTVGAARDITERKREESITKMQYKITTLVAETKNLKDLINSIKILLGEIIDTSNFFVALYDKKRDVLQMPFISDKYQEIDEWPAQKTCTGYIMRENRAMLLSKNDLTSMASQGIIDIIGEPAQQWLGIPLRIESDVIGAFVVQSYDNPQAYNIKDLEMLEFISSNISLAIKRKQDEQKIDLLGTSIDQSPVSIVIADKYGTIQYVNSTFVNVSGYTKKETIGHKVVEFKKHLDEQIDIKNISLAVRDGKNWQGELMNRKKNGEIFWENVSISPVFDENNHIINYIAIKEDITEKKNFIKELVIAKEMAEESDRLKSAFLANISHEIRTPLNGILGFAEYLSNGGLSNDEVIEYSSVISRCGERLLNLIENILSISKIDSGKGELHFAKNRASSLIKEVANQFFFSTKDAGLKIEIKIPENYHEIEIETDLLKLHQILSNFTTNAVKFTKEGIIEIGYNIEENNYITFYVKDSGIGIAPENQNKIFERFYQIDNSFSRGYEGAGLGLSLCLSLAKLLNGEIWLESHEGKGSTFFLRLPLSQ